MRHAYLHGFGSSPRSKKGTRLAAEFAKAGITLEQPDLNCPSFAKLSPAAQIAALEEMTRGQTWKLVGSSLGGWLAARFAELYPERVEGMVLLCPGFDMARRWPAIVGTKALEQWKREGSLLFPDADGTLVPVHYAFYEEGKSTPPYPAARCPILIVHGTRDETVPIDSSRRYAAEHANVRLLEVDDVHDLLASIPTIVSESTRFFA